MSIFFLALFALDSKYLIEDPAAAQRVDYLILSADAFADRLDELAAHREKQGLAVGIVKMSAVKERFDSVRAFLAYAVEKWSKPAPRYLLIVGDHDAVPAVVRDGEMRGFMSEKDLATDFEYACPRRELEPELHVGRFPCDTAGELALMIRKTLDYEKKLAPGAWQKRVRFIAGEAGFSKELDSFIEKQFRELVAGGIPAEYDIEVAFASPRSPYCPFPPKFNDNAVRLLNEGSLFYVFVGHGSRTGVDSIRWNGRSFDILEAKNADRVDVREGLPVMVVVACNTGEFDHASDCVGEVFFKRPRGPVAFLGGSRVTQPYGNGLLGKALIDQAFGDARTLGEVVTRAKAQILLHEASKFTKQADFMASMQQGKEALEPMRRDVVRHYNLLGDPALVLRKPRPSLAVELDGDVARVLAAAPEVELTLECAREVFARPVERKIEETEEKMAERYRSANDRVLAKWTLRAVDGIAEVKIPRPKEPGAYFLKARAGGQVGVMKFEVAP